MRLEGRVSIVTGAARGIGDIARLPLEAAPPWSWWTCPPKGWRRRWAVCRQRACAPMYVLESGNVSKVKEMVQDVLARHRRIDILVNNAGICPTTPVEEIPEAEWDKVLEINLKAPFFLCQAVIPAMKEQRYGKIINIASIAGEMGALVAGCHYSASKGGMLTLTKVLARLLGPWGINVNSVAPGTIDSVMTADWSPEQRKMLTDRIPLGRLGQPIDIAQAVAFLASDESSFITGATIDVNGGALMR